MREAFNSMENALRAVSKIELKSLQRERHVSAAAVEDSTVPKDFSFTSFLSMFALSSLARKNSSCLQKAIAKKTFDILQ